MKHGWDDILRFLFNAVLVLAIIGLLLIFEKGERPSYEGEVYQEIIWEIIA